MKTATPENRQGFTGHLSSLMAKAIEPVSETKRTARGELRSREPMARHVSWRTGGPAEAAYFPLDLLDLARFVRTLPAAEPVHVVGLGSNLLVRDGGLRGTVIFTHRSLRALRLAPRDRKSTRL